MKRWLIVGSICLVAATASGQGAEPPASAPEEGPIRCWWLSSSGAVRIGEPFDVSLTCSVLDNAGAQVVLDETRLSASVIQMAPFEVVGGSHPADMHTGDRRFFQYHYTLRIISPDAIGQDAPLPPIALRYRVNSRAEQGNTLQGRELVYDLPEQSIRVVSMVPDNTGDIRDASGEDLGTVERLRSRASILNIVAFACIGLGALMSALVVVNLALRAKQRTPAGERVLASHAVASAALRELSAVKQTREAQGWDERLVDRALASARILTALALGRPVSQRPANEDDTSTDGRLVVSRRVRGGALAVSSPITSRDVANAPAPRGQTIAPHLSSLADAVASLSSARYGRPGVLDERALDAAVAAAIDAGAQVKAHHGRIRTFARGFSRRTVRTASRA